MPRSLRLKNSVWDRAKRLVPWFRELPMMADVLEEGSMEPAVLRIALERGLKQLEAERAEATSHPKGQQIPLISVGTPSEPLGGPVPPSPSTTAPPTLLDPPTTGDPIPPSVALVSS